MTGSATSAASSADGRQAALRARAADLFPGGVNSPVRAFRSVGRPPLILDAGKGPRVRDADGRWYLDYIGSWGPAILGHGAPAVIEAVREAALDGFALGATGPREVELGERIRAAMPSMERMRFVSSGTEAVMSAIRLARGATGRDLLVKFAGGYHGHGDSLLADAGSGLATLAMPGSAGVTAGAAGDTVVLPYNDVAAVAAAFRAHPGRIAAIIVEPVGANVGVIAPVPGFLEALREQTAANGALLIFDEVITGFRVAHGGAQARFGVTPDLTTLGKIIGGGMPIGAYGGRADLMAHIAPEGPVYQAGTLSGHPLAMAAGVATLDLLDTGGVRGPRADRCRAGDGAPPGRGRCRPRGRDRAGGLAAHGVLPVWRATQLGRGRHRGPRRLRPLLRRDAGQRRPPRSLPVRGLVRLRSAR